MRACLQGHDDLLQRGVACTLTDPIDGHLFSVEESETQKFDHFFCQEKSKQVARVSVI
jgi:hypothetical protein